MLPLRKSKEFEEFDWKMKEETEEEEPQSLNLLNFFSSGWDKPFRNRSRVGRSPRLHLFTTKQPFLDREARLNYNFIGNGEFGLANLHELDFEFEIPFDRRYMIDVEPRYTWIDGRNGARDTNALGVSLISYFQLFDMHDTAMNFQFGVTPPTQGLGIEIEEEPSEALQGGREPLELNFVLAGWQDLTQSLGLYRTSVSCHVEYITFVGPNASSETDHYVTYGLSLAKTFTEPDATRFRDLTFFIENFATIPLDGQIGGNPTITFTPGFRWNIGTANDPWWIMTGVEVAVDNPDVFDYALRFSIIHWFD